MTDPTSLEVFLAGARLDAAVTALRPDYRALLIAVDGIAPGGTSVTTPSEDLLVAPKPAERAPRERPRRRVPHVAAWREAYRAFGVEPQRTRNSLEALAASRRVLVVRGSTGSPTSTTPSASSTRYRREART